jgi:predicted helicase
VRTASDRGQLIMACGTGKTLVGLPRAEAESTRTLVLAFSLSLLAQTLREWTANAERAFRYLAVCSG